MLRNPGDVPSVCYLPSHPPGRPRAAKPLVLKCASHPGGGRQAVQGPAGDGDRDGDGAPFPSLSARTSESREEPTKPASAAAGSCWAAGALPRCQGREGLGGPAGAGEAGRRRRYRALTRCLRGRACHLASVPGINVPERSQTTERVRGKCSHWRRPGPARGVRRRGRVSALKRRVRGGGGHRTPAWQSVAAPLSVGGRVRGGTRPVQGPRRPAQAVFVPAAALWTEEGSGHCGGPRPYRW